MFHTSSNLIPRKSEAKRIMSEGGPDRGRERGERGSRGRRGHRGGSGARGRHQGGDSSHGTGLGAFAGDTGASGSKRGCHRGKSGSNSDVNSKLGSKSSHHPTRDRNSGNSSVRRPARGSRGRRNGQKRLHTPYFEAWMPDTEVRQGIEDGTIFTGVLRINGKNRREAFVRCDGIDVDVFVDGEKYRNRALNGDVVAVELFPRSEWNERRELKPEVNDMMQAMKALELEDDEGLWQPQIQQGSSAAKQVVQKSQSSNRNENLQLGNLQPSGKVVRVLAANEEAGMNLERVNAQVHVGMIAPQFGFDRTSPNKVQAGKPLPARDSFVEFRPLDSRVPFLLIRREEVPFEFLQDPLKFAPPNQKLFEASIAKWSEKHRFPKGKLLRQIGEAGEIGPETEALLIEANCDHGEFPEDAINVLKDMIPEDASWEIPEAEIRKRKDLRLSKRIFTVDPSTAKDLDDALHCVKVEAGKVRGRNGAYLPAHFEVGVHIADVTYFLEPGTPLDREAQRRSTTVYLVNRVLPMLPPILSEELCSLNEGVDRLAYSCIWRMTEDGDMLLNAPPPWFGRTVICSCARLDYGLAQRMFDGNVTEESVDTGNDADENCWPTRRAPQLPHTKAQVIEDVRNLVNIAMARRKKRFDKHKGGALGLQANKLSFTRDEEGNPTGVTTYPIRDTNRTIEEYMLIANYLVAQRLILGADKMAFIRHHPPPDPRGMTTLVETLMKHGVQFDANALGSAAGLNTTLQNLSRTQSKDMMAVIYHLLRKPMKPAKYATAGSLEQNHWRHWALNIPYYTHFTSPIRRYADVVVHRLLSAVLDGSINEFPDSLEELDAIAEHCNEKKEASKSAQDASDRLFLCIFIKQRFEAGDPICSVGIVQELGPNSFKLLIGEFEVECRVHADNDWKASNVRPTYSRVEGGDGASKKNNHRSDSRASGHSNRQPKDEGPEDTENGDVIALSMTIFPGTDHETPITLEVLSQVKVRIEPEISNNGRIDFKTIFIQQLNQ